MRRWLGKCKKERKRIREASDPTKSLYESGQGRDSLCLQLFVEFGLELDLSLPQLHLKVSPSDQLVGGERLRQVVVGSCEDTSDPLLVSRSSSQNDERYRSRLRVGPNGGEELVPVLRKERGRKERSVPEIKRRLLVGICFLSHSFRCSTYHARHRNVADQEVDPSFESSFEGLLSVRSLNHVAVRRKDADEVSSHIRRVVWKKGRSKFEVSEKYGS